MFKLQKKRNDTPYSLYALYNVTWLNLPTRCRLLGLLLSFLALCRPRRAACVKSPMQSRLPCRLPSTPASVRAACRLRRAAARPCRVAHAKQPTPSRSC